jgi:hypothetical protein
MDVATILFSNGKIHNHSNPQDLGCHQEFKEDYYIYAIAARLFTSYDK